MEYIREFVEKVNGNLEKMVDFYVRYTPSIQSKRRILINTCGFLSKEKHEQFLELLMDRIEEYDSKYSVDMWRDFIYYCPKGLKRYMDRYKTFPSNEILESLFSYNYFSFEGIQGSSPKTLVLEMIRIVRKTKNDELQEILLESFGCFSKELKIEIIEHLSKEISFEKSTFRKLLEFFEYQLYFKDENYQKTLEVLMRKVKFQSDLDKIAKVVAMEKVGERTFSKDSELQYIFMEVSRTFSDLSEKLNIIDSSF